MINPQELIDTELYPIDDLGSLERAALVERCHWDLDAHAFCALQGFVRPDVVAQMAAEADRLAKSGYKNENMRTPYGWMYNRDFPEGHPRAAKGTSPDLASAATSKKKRRKRHDRAARDRMEASPGQRGSRARARAGS